ncbi:hypothetical protein B0H15DRAFT_805482 [Mycena belliarum]|uniref:Uncharacterized protein n=1 Tax=Mycena belliarum TaxID=1033014 RepID=A0AAD6XK61_9AGAR|nr:hypothetical protein B0H15DRAFT_805482 [Mycena belliae]
MSQPLPRPHYPGTDSRIFTTARLLSFQGFDECPVVDDGMLFRLPPILSFHSRVVTVAGRKWMIWSANSIQDPYYPGPRASQGIVFRDPDSTQRRYDGRGGRWDYTRVPQTYSAIRPWLGFIRREGWSGAHDVEFTPVHSVWDTTSAYQVGRLQDAFLSRMVARNTDLDRQMFELLPQILYRRTTLCPYRPKFPTRDVMAGLAAVEEYERAVDLAAECQAGMKEKDAWITMVRLWLAQPFPEPYVLQQLSIMPADEEYLGVWINGAPAEDPLWFLTTAAVPCFVISEIAEGTPVDQVANGFLAGTDVGSMREAYEFDRIGIRGGVSTPTELRTSAATPLARTPFDRRRATLRWQMDVPEGRWLAATVFDTSAAPPSHIPSLASGSESAPMDEDRGSPTPSGYGPMAPPVAPPARSAGPWTVFVEDDDEDGETRMKKRGGRHKGKADLEGEQEMWYDRTLKRKLIFDDLPPAPDGLPSDEEYGRPVPEWPFGMDSNGNWLPDIPSMWMYRREAPTPERIGEQPPILSRAPSTAQEERPVEVPLRGDLSRIFEDDIAPAVPNSPTPSDWTERPLSEAVLSREATPPSEEGTVSPPDIRMSSPISERSTPEVEQPPIRDCEGRDPTTRVLLRGIPPSWTADSLRRWTRTIGQQDNPLRLRRAFRVVRSPRIDALIEFFDNHDAQPSSSAERWTIATTTEGPSQVLQDSIPTSPCPRSPDFPLRSLVARAAPLPVPFASPTIAVPISSTIPASTKNVPASASFASPSVPTSTTLSITHAAVLERAPQARSIPVPGEIPVPEGETALTFARAWPTVATSLAHTRMARGASDTPRLPPSDSVFSSATSSFPARKVPIECSLQKVEYSSKEFAKETEILGRAVPYIPPFDWSDEDIDWFIDDEFSGGDMDVDMDTDWEDDLGKQ